MVGDGADLPPVEPVGDVPEPEPVESGWVVSEPEPVPSPEPSPFDDHPSPPDPVVDPLGAGPPVVPVHKMTHDSGFWGPELHTVHGDVKAWEELNHTQGQNSRGFGDTSGAVAAEGILSQFGIHTTEAELVDRAADAGLCVVSDDLDESGGLAAAALAQLLSDQGVPAHVESHYEATPERLAVDVNAGKGVMVEVSDLLLYEADTIDELTRYDVGEKHWVTITGAAYSPEGELAGFYVNDPLTGESGQFFTASPAFCWDSVVTDAPLPMYSGGPDQR